MRRTIGTFAVAAAGLMVLAGCNQGPDLPPLQRVSGVVRIDGKPLERGTVQFQPDKSKGTDGPLAVGTIGPDGRYELTTAQSPGAMIGHHTVAVVSRAVPKDETDTLPASLIPDHYGRHETSGISKEVTADGPNTIDIDLTSQSAP